MYISSIEIGLLRAKITHVKIHSKTLGSPNRYEIDLSNEELNIDFGQGAKKISEHARFWPGIVICSVPANCTYKGT